MNGLFRKNGQQCTVPRRLKSSLPNGRRWITFCALASLFLNILIPISQANQSMGENDEFIEICTQSGIKQVSAVELFALDTGFTDQENCPICTDCPLCWQAQSTVLLSTNDIWKIEAWGYKQAPFVIDNDPVWANPGNSWPDSRAPPRI